MAISFPIGIHEHFEQDSAGGLKVIQRNFLLTDPRSLDETVGGDAIVATYGTNLWYGDVTVVPLHNALQRKLEAKVRVLGRHDARFYIGDVMDDPIPGLTGTQTLAAVNSTDNHIIRIAGLPSGLVLPVGTKISFDYGGGRRALHEIGTRGAASSSGELTVTVFPILQPGWVIGNTVQLGDQSRCKAFMVPGSLKPGTAGPDSTPGFTFGWRQTLEK